LLADEPARKKAKVMIVAEVERLHWRPSVRSSHAIPCPPPVFQAPTLVCPQGLMLFTT
jgi:hypothetical protein